MDLVALLAHAKGFQLGESLSGPASAKYTKLAVDAVKDVPDERGFYLWGTYERTGLWRNIYLGKAGFGKTANLRARILEELRDERCLFWSGVLGRDRILTIGAQSYPIMWTKYRRHWERSLRKSPDQLPPPRFVIWVSSPELTNAFVVTVEADLIETLNPVANSQRPAPKAVLQVNTLVILEALRREIHKARPALSPALPTAANTARSP